MFSCLPGGCAYLPLEKCRDYSQNIKRLVQPTIATITKRATSGPSQHTEGRKPYLKCTKCEATLIILVHGVNRGGSESVSASALQKEGLHARRLIASEFGFSFRARNNAYVALLYVVIENAEFWVAITCTNGSWIIRGFYEHYVTVHGSTAVPVATGVRINQCMIN